LLISFSSVSASSLQLGLEDQNTNSIGINFIPEVSINYSSLNTNNSQFLQGYTPITLRDFFQLTYDTLYSDITEPVALSLGNWSADMGDYYTSTQTDTAIETANTSVVNWADGKFVVNSGDSLSGQYDFNGGWTSDGLSIIDGNIYAQTGYFYNISGLGVNNLLINGSLLPTVGYDNQFDIGNSTLRWNDLYLGGDIYSSGSAYLGRNLEVVRNVLIDGQTGMGIVPTGKLSVDGEVKVGDANDGVWIRRSGTKGEILGIDQGGAAWNDVDIRAGSATQVYLKTDGNTIIGLDNNKIIQGTDNDYSQYFDGTNQIYNLVSGIFRFLDSMFIDGDLDVTGNITGNQIYGGMFYHNHTATQLNFAVDGQFYQLFMPNATHINGFSHEDDSLTGSNLTAQVTGLYQASYMASGDGQNNHEYYTSVFVNEVNQDNCEYHHKMASGGDIITQNGVCFIAVSVGDKISLRTADIGGTGTGNYYSSNLNLVRIGD